MFKRKKEKNISSKKTDDANERNKIKLFYGSSQDAVIRAIADRSRNMYEFKTQFALYNILRTYSGYVGPGEASKKITLDASKFKGILRCDELYDWFEDMAKNCVYTPMGIRDILANGICGVGYIKNYNELSLQFKLLCNIILISTSKNKWLLDKNNLKRLIMSNKNLRISSIYRDDQSGIIRIQTMGSGNNLIVTNLIAVGGSVVYASCQTEVKVPIKEYLTIQEGIPELFGLQPSWLYTCDTTLMQSYYDKTLMNDTIYSHSIEETMENLNSEWEKISDSIIKGKNMATTFQDMSFARFSDILKNGDRIRLYSEGLSTSWIMRDGIWAPVKLALYVRTTYGLRTATVGFKIGGNAITIVRLDILTGELITTRMDIRGKRKKEIHTNGYTVVRVSPFGEWHKDDIRIIRDTYNNKEAYKLLTMTKFGEAVRK